MKKKYRILFLSLVIFLLICLFFLWYVFNFFRDLECCDFTGEFKKGNLIIQKIEDYRKSKGKLPELLDDIGEDPKSDGPIYYKKIDSDNYEIWFGTTLGSSCVYKSETKEWTPEG